MMIKCDQHGLCEGLEVSPDLKEKVDNSEEIAEYILINYEYNDEIVDWLFLSVEYAAKYGLQTESRLPLPDDYPEWVKSLVPVCEKCFEEHTKFRISRRMG